MRPAGAIVVAAFGGALGSLAAAVAASPMAPPASFAPTPAPDGGGVIGAIWRTMAAGFDHASAAREPPPRPPVPIKVTWKARRVASLDLGAPLLALAAGDLDGDGKAELIALTERHVVVLQPAGKGLGEIARVALPSEPASIRPRDAVGALSIAVRAGGADVLARASTAGRGARYQLDGKGLHEVGAVSGFPLCADSTDELAPGRNYFARADAPPYDVIRCTEGLVDGGGRPLRAEATVAVGGKLTVAIDTRCAAGEAGCVAHREVTRDKVGVAIDVDDVDHDGTLEVIISGAGAPGDADAVAVFTVGPHGLGKKPVFRRAFSGGVAAICAGDVDGDGDRDVFAAVRLAGARKVDLWLLD